MKWNNQPGITDDIVILLEAIADFASTVSGATVAIAEAIAPAVIAFSPTIEMPVKLAALGSGIAGTGGGVLIARQNPKFKRENQNAIIEDSEGVGEF